MTPYFLPWQYVLKSDSLILRPTLPDTRIISATLSGTQVISLSYKREFTYL